MVWTGRDPEDHDEDGNPIKGILIGLVISVILWLLIKAVIFDYYAVKFGWRP